MIKRVFKKNGLLCLAIIIALNNSYGQTTPGPSSNDLENLSLKELLNTKVTTVSKTSQELEMAPATVTVITREQIKIRGYQSLLDVLYDLPDIKIDDKIYSGIRSSFVVRGTQGQDKFIILLDGVRISSPIDEALPIMENYPVNLAEQIEVVYGPASALYGANAVSGVINIITKKATTKKNTVVDASTLAGDNGYTNSAIFISQKISDQVSLIVSGQYFYDKQPDLSKTFKDDPATSIADYSTGTINTAYGPVTPQKSITAAYDAPMEACNFYAALQTGDFTLAYFRNSSKTSSSYGSNTSNALFNKDAFIKQGIKMINATYKKSFNKLTTTTAITASDYTLDPESNYRNLYTGFQPAYKYETCSTIKGEEQLDYKAFQNLNITAGISYEKFSVVPYSADLEGSVDENQDIHASYSGTTNYYSPEGMPAQFYFLKYYNAGSYLQAQYSPVKKINFTIGARYDKNSRYGSTFNPRVGMVYKPFDKTTVKLLYGSAYLAPSPATSYAYWGSFVTADSGKTFSSYFMHLPNPDLKPITSHNAEINVRQYLSNNFSITVDGYYTQLTNLLGFANDNESTHLYNNTFNGIPVDYIEVYVNQARQENYGGSIQINLKQSMGRFKMNSYASVSYVDGKVQSALNEEEELTLDAETDFISHFMIHVGGDVKVGKFSFSPRVIFMTHQNISGIADTVNNILERQSIPGYTLLNISLRYNASKRVSFFANATNVLNQRYRSVGFLMDLKKENSDLFYGQPEDPIRIMGGINFTF